MDQNLGMEKVGRRRLCVLDCCGCCASSINLFINRLVNLKIADIWWLSALGLFLQSGCDKCAYLSVVQNPRFAPLFFGTSQSRSKLAVTFEDH